MKYQVTPIRFTNEETVIPEVVGDRVEFEKNQYARRSQVRGIRPVSISHYGIKVEGSSETGALVVTWVTAEILAYWLAPDSEKERTPEPIRLRADQTWWFLHPCESPKIQ